MLISNQKPLDQKKFCFGHSIKSPELNCIYGNAGHQKSPMSLP